MLDTNTIIFVKENLINLNYLVGIISFLFGIAPLFMERTRVERQANVIYIEISAAIFLIFTISMVSLDYISEIPLYKKNECIRLRSKYIEDIPFKELRVYEYNNKVISTLNSDIYLLKNLKYGNYRSIPKKKDFKYKKISCL